MRWTLTDFNREAQALYLANCAKNIDDLDRASRLHKCPGQNWVYADDQGNIGFRAAVGIPVRDGFDAGKLLPGWDGKYEWSGYVPTEDQPYLRNPEKGYIATANNKPVNDYPYTISSYYAPPDRITRITRLIEEQDKLGIDDFKRMHADQYMIMAEQWVPKIMVSVEAHENSELEQKALNILKKWDYFAYADQTAPAIFHVLLQNTIEITFKDKLGDSLYTYWLSNPFIVHNAINSLLNNNQSQWFDDPKTDKIETRDDVLSLAFIGAIEFLSDKLGDNPEDWTWGKLHTLTLFHPVGRQIPILGKIMNVGPFPMDGGSHTLNPGLYRLTEPYRMLAGASQRHIFDLGNMKNSLRIIPAGISGNFMSDHYADQFDLWRKVEYRPFVLDREDVEADAKYVLTILPQEALKNAAQENDDNQ
jgi:penicillin amidase